MDTRRRGQPYRRNQPRPVWRRWLRIAWLTTGALVGVFVMLNVALYATYRQRTYPQTKVVDASVGSVAYDDLATTVAKQDILPDTVTFAHGNKQHRVAITDLGVRLDDTRTIASAARQRSWLPIINLFRRPILQAPIRFDTPKLRQATTDIAKTFDTAPVNPRLQLAGTTVTVQSGVPGFTLDGRHLQQAVTKALDSGKTTVDAPGEVTRPGVAIKDLADDQQNLQRQLDTPITFRYATASKQPSKSDIAAWFVPQGEVYALAPDKVQAYIGSIGKSFGITVKDRAAVAAATAAAIAQYKPVDTILTAVTIAKNYRYCTATKGVTTNELATLRSKLQSTYSDSRGWSLNGIVAYSEVSSGCDFTVWLSAASQMPSFGTICDAEWSCRVGPNVVLNYDRWMGASPAWNQYGGSLEDYRHMVINHETGHWLGFGHDHCPGAGQQAPVMQQQSISLQGCTFSPWPNSQELGVLRNRLGL